MADRAQVDVVIKGNSAGLNKAVDKASTRVKGFVTGALKQMGGAIIAAFAVQRVVQFGQSMLKMADDLQTSAKVFNVSLESMIAWQGVMAESGIGVEKFIKIFGRLTAASADVKRGLTTYVYALEDMKINQEEWMALPVDKKLELMAKRYGEVADKAEFLGGVAKMMGVRMVGLAEVFDRINAAGGMAKFEKEAEKSAEGIRKLAEASDELERMENAFKMWAASLVPPLLTVSKLLMKIYDTASAIAGVGLVASIMDVGALETARQLITGETFKSIWKKDEPKAKPIPELKITEGGTTSEEDKKIKTRTKEDVKYEEKWNKFREEQYRDELKKQTITMRIKGLELLKDSKQGADTREELLEQEKEVYKIEKEIYELKKEQKKQIEKKNNEYEKGLKDYFKDEEAFADMFSKGKEREEGETFEQGRFNELARIGGQIGGAPNAAVGNAIKSLSIQEKTATNTDEMNKKLAQIVPDIRTMSVAMGKNLGWGTLE